MTDRDMVSEIKAGNDSLKINLWNRYERLVHKNWHILVEQMNKSSGVLSMEDDYYSDAYIAFEKTLEAIDLAIIRDDNWKFLGYFRFYLKNVRTAIIKQIRSKAANEKSFYIKTDEGSVPRMDLSSVLVENNYMANPEAEYEYKQGIDRSKEAIKNCLKKWNPRQIHIYDMLRKGYLKQDIAETLDLSPPTISYYVNKMRADLAAELGITFSEEEE